MEYYLQVFKYLVGIFVEDYNIWNSIEPIPFTNKSSTSISISKADKNYDETFVFHDSTIDIDNIHPNTYSLSSCDIYIDLSICFSTFTTITISLTVSVFRPMSTRYTYVWDNNVLVLIKYLRVR